MKALEKEYPHTRNGLIWLIQDGKEAGQTVSPNYAVKYTLVTRKKVPHVHLHIIPKRFSEWYQNGIEDKDRVPRTIEAMKIEAERLKIKFL
jgi:diadenosine tetraphosphate (Ap4A) HIT family hydrolase